MIGRGVAAGLAAVFVAFPAAAAVNVERDPGYEKVSLDQCAASYPERACRCALETRQQSFAAQISTRSEDSMIWSEPCESVPDLIARCKEVE
jgi:hypothetical protein